jgi:peptidoglycan/LPS O-acetylase OafA/YrhL
LRCAEVVIPAAFQAALASLSPMRHKGEFMTLARDNAAAPTRTVSLDYLRGFVTLLVVLYHSFLGYMALLPSSAPLSTGIWRSIPIVDQAKWLGFDAFATLNNIYFMSLMFLLSGLFVWSSLKRKGAADFLRDRWTRLGLPYLFCLLVLAPLAYYPANLAGGDQEGPAAFWLRFLPMGARGLTGPAWFLWMLLAFDALAALVFIMAPRADAVLARFAALGERPPILFLGLVALSGLAYLPLAAIFGVEPWTNLGPFSFQLSRPLHYLLYFAVGVALGAPGVGKGLFAPDGRLAERWALWALFAVALTGCFLGLAAKAQTATGEAQQILEMIQSVLWVVSCAASSFALIALFVRFMRKPDPLWASFSANAYGIYLVHYAIVVWLQFTLMRADWPGLVKGLVVAAFAVPLSWSIAAAARRLPLVARSV